MCNCKMIYLTQSILTFNIFVSFLILLNYHLAISVQNTRRSTIAMSQPSIRLSPMVENMAVSKTIEMMSMTKEMERKGIHVYSLSVGEPDYEPPLEVLEATNKAATTGITKYTAVNGEASLRQAIAKDLTERKGTTYSADQIVVSNGAKQSVIQTLLALVSPGDNVLIPAPYWVSYIDMVKMCGGVPVIIKTYPKDKYQLTADTLRKALSENPKITAIILCNPSNPTGCVSDKKMLLEMAKVFDDYPKVFIISDEIYERLTYDCSHTAFASLPNMYDRTITINGFSKSHSMTGYRLGYSASHITIAKANSKIQGQMTSCASSISQYAGLIALNDVSDKWMEDRVKELKEKRDFAYDLLMKIPHVMCPKPDGAFYLLPDVSYYYNTKTVKGNDILNSNDMCIELLRDEQVAFVGGEAFGADDCVRLSYATSKEVIEIAITRFARFLASLTKS